MTRSAMDRIIDTIEAIAAIFVGLVAVDIFLSVLLRRFFSLQIPDPAVRTVRTVSLNSFLCPSSIGTGPVTLSNGGGTLLVSDLAPGQYVASAGQLEPVEFPASNNGVFYRNSRIGVRDITDGAEQTIFLGERSHGLGGATWTGSVTNAFLDTGDAGSIARHARATSPGMVLGHTGDGYGPGDSRSSVNQFSSLHSGGGVQFAFGDGHVAFLRSTMNAKTYRALATRAGGEVVPAGGY